MSKIEELKQTYLKDADLMASKSRFGYFSIPPNAAAGLGCSNQKKVIKDQNGKVKTQERNIFSGLTASGVLKKSFFNYETSVFRGDQYTDPGKHERVANLQESKKLLGKDVYKPANLVKTPEPNSAYDHIPEKPIQKTVKDCIDQNGKVITQPRGVMASSTLNIQKQRLKQYKYVHDPYENFKKVNKEQAQKSIKLRGEASFKSSSPMKPEFYTARQTYGKDEKCLVKQQKKQKQNGKTVQHDSTFKPSCIKKFDTFSYPEYLPGGQKPGAKTTRKAPTSENSKETFRFGCPHENTKPSPSISTFKANILRTMR